MTISSIVFTCIFAGALLGMALRLALPEHHLSTDSRDAMKLGLGLIGTMSALVLGLMVSSAKSSYDTQKNEVTQMAAKIILLDRTLAQFGPKATEARKQLRDSVEHAFYQMWPEDKSRPAQLVPTAAGAESLFDKIHELEPMNEAQRSLHARAQSIVLDLGETRWLLFEQSGSAISPPFLVVLVVWLTLIFLGFGLLAPRNPTVVVTLLLCALSVSGAIFLILELDRPFDGMIQISGDPVRKALANLGQ
jgi:hypothetical protein